MPFCTKCGTEVPENVKFCSKCGTNLQAQQNTNNNNEQAKGLSLWGYYIKCLKNYVSFKGRARRKEYWGFMLFNFIIALAVTTLGIILFEEETGEVLGNLYLLATFIPQIAVHFRRFHDIGKSGWLVLLSFTIVGIVLVLIWLCTDSENCENEYGPDPKGRE